MYVNQLKTVKKEEMESRGEGAMMVWAIKRAKNCYDERMTSNHHTDKTTASPVVVGKRELQEHIESGSASYGEEVYLEIFGNSFSGELVNTGRDVMVVNGDREYIIYSEMFPTRTAWNFSKLSYRGNRT